MTKDVETRDRRSKLIVYAARGTAFFLPLIVAAAFVNMGQTSCCSSGDCARSLTQCEAAVVCSAGACIVVGSPAGGGCDFAATGDGICDGAGGCVENLCFGVPADFCEDTNPCTNDVPCEPLLGCPAPPFLGEACDLFSKGDGRCDASAVCVEPEGDLGPTGVSLVGNVLSVSIRNHGDTVLPANKGNVKVFVDEILAFEIGLGELLDDSYRQPLTEQTISTGIRLGRPSLVLSNPRRIAVLVDTENEILESDEYHNDYSRTTGPVLWTSGSDYQLTDLFLNQSNELVIAVDHQGSAVGPSDLRFEVSIDDESVADFSTQINATGVTEITPSPPIVLADPTRVHVTMTALNPADETDSVPNIRQELIPYALPTEYTDLLNHPAISQSMRWEDASGVSSYPDWDPAMKAQLADAIRDIETSETVVGPTPENATPGYYTTTEAQQIYLGHVAHSLWVEANALVGWSLTDYPAEQLDTLFDLRKYVAYSPSLGLYSKNIPDPVDPSLLVSASAVLSWNPRVNYEFMRVLDIIDPSSPVETTYAITEWMQAHIVHGPGGDADSLYLAAYGETYVITNDMVLYPFEAGYHIIPGCPYGTAIYASLLRSINIPVESRKHVYASFINGDLTHHFADFPSLGFATPHADIAYLSWWAAGNSIHPSVIFFTTAEMDSLFTNPQIECLDGVCNTLGEQKGCNVTLLHQRFALALSNQALRDYAFMGESLFRSARLPTEPPCSLLSQAEQDEAVSAITTELIRLGSGDIEAGKAIAIQRNEDWKFAKENY